MKVENNDLVWGSSGRIGDMLVFKQVAGKTIIVKRPRKRETPPSESQQMVTERFTEAVQYAKGVASDEVKKAVYQLKVRPGVSAYNLALSDYCKAPEIKKVNLTGYTGQVSEQILIRAIDDFMVRTVQVEILDKDLLRIEQGEAILSDNNNLDWIYTSKTLNPDPENSIIRISASDLPGNVTTKDYVVGD